MVYKLTWSIWPYKRHSNAQCPLRYPPHSSDLSYPQDLPRLLYFIITLSLTTTRPSILSYEIHSRSRIAGDTCPRPSHQQHRRCRTRLRLRLRYSTTDQHR